MATINLGSIKFKWQGAYAGGTAYTVDDVVSYQGSSYICIQASTGNLPTNATYWEQMSSAGTNGTDGTDLTTTLTTQGDILYRNASGLARLGAGTNGQALITGGTGANPSWGDVSGSIGQVISTNKTSTFGHTFNTSGFVDITGFSATITPASSSSKVLILVQGNASAEAGNQATFRLTRAGTTIYVGDTSTNRRSASTMAYGNSSSIDFSASAIVINTLDSPNTTSATTYQVQMGGFSGGSNYLNRTLRDSSVSGDYDNRLASSITLIEVL